MSDIITNFVEQSHNEQGPRTELRMRKEAGGAGFYIRAKGGKKAIKQLADALNVIDRQLPRPEGRGLRLRKKSCRVRVADSSC